jgi:glycine/D-amino acid oxidase-like deaminating enzyme
MNWWIKDAPLRAALAPLEGKTTAQTVIIGAGYLGLWSAWHLLREDPEQRVIILERDLCGYGPSSRNGGIVTDYRKSAAALELGKELVLASIDAFDELAAWAKAHDADWTETEHWLLAENEREVSNRDYLSEQLSDYSGWRRLQQSELNAKSSQFMAGIATRAATVHPAKLVNALRAEVLDMGARIYERTPVFSIEEKENQVLVRTKVGLVKAEKAIVAAGVGTGRLPWAKDYLTQASSHIVLTEPIAEQLEDLHWQEEALSDGKTMLHYMRPTKDRRLLFGWGGGHLNYLGRRPSPRRDLELYPLIEKELRRLFGFDEVKIEACWGGPVDVSADRLPFFVSEGRLTIGAGFSGQGISAAYMGGQICSALSSDSSHPWTHLPLVNRELKKLPPEPLRSVGGNLVRSALIREEENPSPVSGFIAGLPKRLGMSIPR